MSRLDRLDELLATPTELPEGFEQRLLAIPDTSRRAPRRWIAAAAAAVVLAAGALALQPRSVEPGAAVVSEPSRPDRVVVALRHPSATGRVFLEGEGDRILVTLHRLARDRDPTVAVPAIEHLGTLARKASLPVLVDVIRLQDRCAAAIQALAAVGDPSAARAIAPYLADPFLFPVARDALVAVGGRAAVQALLDRLGEVEKPADLVLAVGGMRDPEATRGLLDLLDRPPLEAALRKALADKRHRLALLDAAQGRDAVRAHAAIGMLARLREPESVPVLRALLADASRRKAAAHALAAIDTAEAGAALLDGLGAGGVREAFDHAGPGIETWLLARIESADRRERHRIVGLLAFCGSDASVDVLARLAADPALAPEIVRTLGRVGGVAAVEALEGMARRSALRRPVLDALVSTRSVEAVPVLVRLGVSDRRLRRPVIAALGRIPHADAVRAILTLDGRPDTRRTTARALRAMDPDTVVPTLVAMLEGDQAGEARRWLDAVSP